MSKAKVIAVSSMCAAVALGCLLLASIPAMGWMMLILGVIASVALVIPMLLDAKNIVFSLLAYLTCGALGVFLGLSNVVFVAPIVTFCIPFAIVKVWGETVSVTATVDGEKTLEDPFGNGDDRKVVSVKVNKKTKLPKVVKWILYFVLLEVGITLTLLAAYLFTPPVFETLMASKYLWLVVGLLQLIVFPYDVLMNGCLLATCKILQKAVKPQ